MKVLDYINKALSFKGVAEGSAKHKQIIDIYNTIKPLPQGYKVKYTDSWCATFVSAMAWLVSGGTDTKFPYECSCNRMITLAKKKKIWIEDESTTPCVGWLIMYDWQDTGKGDDIGSCEHVGIVTKVNKKTFEVLEGNKSDKVDVRTLKFDSQYIRGYVAVKYDKEATKTKKKSKTTIAKEVIQGLWGNGEARKTKLEASGYDYYEIQKVVNKLLSN